jgi:hypothetical protein
MKRIALVALLLVGALIAPLPAPEVRAATSYVSPAALALQAMNNLQIFALRYDVDLNRRAAVAVAKQANFVVAGGGDQTTLPKAEAAMNNPEAEREKFIWYIVLNSSVQAAPTSDSAIEAVVATHYDEIWAAPED